MSLYGLLAFRGITINNFLFADKSSLVLYFWYPEEYTFFLDLMDEKDLTVYRYVLADSESMHIFTSDMTLGGEVQLLSGTFPDPNTTQFISNVDTGEATQSGIIRDLYPNTTVAISSIYTTANFSINGIYHISTTDLYVLDNIVYELNNNIDHVQLLSVGGDRAAIFLIALDSILQLYEFVMITILIFLSVLVALAQYSISQLKYSSVLLLHGYSKGKILKATTIKIVKILFLSSLIAYTIATAYLLYTNYTMFLLILSFYFFLTSISLILLYTLTVNIFLLIYLHKTSLLSILKGKRPYYFVQTFNHCLKATFIVFFLITTYFSIQSLTLLNARLSSLSTWEKAENYHRIQVFGGPHFSTTYLSNKTYAKMAYFYEDLLTYHKGFLLFTYNFINLESSMELDGGFFSPSLGVLVAPEVSPQGKTITISPSYLNVNPIIASNGIPIQEQIIYDDYILNILVPEKLREYENDIVREFLHHFYFHKVTVTNFLEYESGLPLFTYPLSTSIEELGIHIIYVEDNQQYFSFDYRVNPGYGNIITDPIAYIFTGNLNKSYLGAHTSTSLYFYSEATDPYGYILPLLTYHNLQDVIRGITSVYDQQGLAIAQLRTQYIRGVSFAIILFISNLTITYNLMANYFEKNKYKLFVKSLFGYTYIKRNMYFLVILLAYSFLASILTGFTLGTHIFFIGLLVMAIDMVVAFAIDHILQNKSFSKIIKGER
jgi:putative ABC transport system permease protein